MLSTFSKITLVFVLLYQNSSGIAQINDPFTSAYSAGMLSCDQFSTNQDVFILQPAILPQMNSTHISTHVQSRFSGFDVVGLALHGATGLPMNFGAGLSIWSLGHPDYKSSDIIASAGKQLSQNIAIGISQRLQRNKIANEGRPWTGSSTAGVLYDNQKWGLSININGLMRWNEQNNPDDFSAQFSGYTQMGSMTHIYFSVNYAEGKIYPVTAIRQTLIKNVEVFGAFQWYPARYGLGFLIPLSDQLDSIVSTQYHPVLGWSPSIGLQWHGKEKEH